MGQVKALFRLQSITMKLESYLLKWGKMMFKAHEGTLKNPRTEELRKTYRPSSMGKSVEIWAF